MSGRVSISKLIVIKIRPNADILHMFCYQFPFNLKNKIFSYQNRAMSRVVVDIVFQIAESKGQFFPIIIMITPKAAPSQEGYEKEQLV